MFPVRSFATLLLLSALAPLALGQNAISTAAGEYLVFKDEGKPAVGATISKIAVVGVDPRGRVTFADPYYHVIFLVDSDGAMRIVAGNGIRGYSGDGGPATSASLNRPSGIAWDQDGNLFIGDTDNHRIRKVDRQGIISTVAGSGVQGVSGDGGPATAARLNFPRNVAVDKAGNLYINDGQNYKIRKVANGTITTFAGNGQLGAGGENFLASSVPIDQVEAMVADSQQNLYIAEFANNRIRKVTPLGVISTYAGTGVASYSGDGGKAVQAKLNRPGGLAFDVDGGLLIMDTGNQVLRKVDASGNISNVAFTGRSGFTGDGACPAQASVRNAFGIAVTSGGDIFVADRDNHRVRRVQTACPVTTVAGGGPPFSMLEPWGVSFDNNQALLIADAGADTIKKLDSSGLRTIAGNGAHEFSGEGGLATNAGLSGPKAVTADGNGVITFTDTDNYVVRQFKEGGTIRTIAGNGSKGIALSTNVATSLPLNNPMSVLARPSGDILIGDDWIDAGSCGAVLRVVNGVLTGFADGIHGPGGIALDLSNNLYLTETYAGNIYKQPAGSSQYLTIFGSGASPCPSARVPIGTQPAGIAADNSGNVYFAEFGANRVRRISPTGTVTTIAGNGTAGSQGDGGTATSASLYNPWGVAVDRDGSNLYIADTQNNRIRRVFLKNPPTITSSTDSVQLNATSDGPVTDTVSVTVGSSLNGLQYNLSTSGEPWLRITQSLASTPGRVDISGDPTGLVAGTYRATVSLTSPAAIPQVKTVNVTMKVDPVVTAVLKVNPERVNELLTGSGIVGTVAVTNEGGGTMDFSASIPDGAAWLTINGATGSVTPTLPGNFTYSIDPSALDGGVYESSIVVTSAKTGTSVTVPIRIVLNAVPAKLLLTQAGMSFNAVAQGASPFPQTVTVVNDGGGAFDWTAKVTAYSGGNWLSIDKTSGHTTAGDGGAPIAFTVDVSKLPNDVPYPTTFYARMLVTAAGVPNSPLGVTVALNVAAPGTAITPEISTGALVFRGINGASPGSQTIQILNTSNVPVTYSTNKATSDGGDWLTFVPIGATIGPKQQAKIVVQPEFAKLNPGSHRGSISLNFSTGSSKQIDVAALVDSPGAPSTKVRENLSGIGCLLDPYQRQPVQPADGVVGQTIHFQLEIFDCAVKAIPFDNDQDTVYLMNFSNGDSKINLKLNHATNWWEGDWTPSRTNASGEMVSYDLFAVRSARAGIDPNPSPGWKPYSMKISQPTNPLPTMTSGVVQNGASYVENVPFAPGTIVTIPGKRLGTKKATADARTQWPTTLGDTEVWLGDVRLPLFYVGPPGAPTSSDDYQVNVQIPFNIDQDTTKELVVKSSAGPSVGATFAVARAQPGIFSQNQQGTGLGIITVHGALVGPDNPVKAGDIIEIRCTGLGPVQGDLKEGVLASESFPVQYPVEVYIDGNTVNEVLYAGSATDYVGQYIVRARVPSARWSSSEVPVGLRVQAQSSNKVTIPIQ